MATIREMIYGLTAIAAEFPTGPDTEVEVAICDGKVLQFVEEVDFEPSTFVPDQDSPQQAREFVLIRIHDHPDNPAMRGRAVDLDQELQQLTDDDDTPEPET